MSTISITDQNVILTAAKYYTNAHISSDDEFLNDLSIVINLRKLFRKYKDKKSLNERLIINHLITMRNVFNITFLIVLLFKTIEPDYHSTLKTFLIHLGYLKTDAYPEIQLDHHIVQVLRAQSK